MKRKYEKFDNETTLGDDGLSAWATSSTHCRIQTNEPKIAAQLRRLPDCEPIGHSVTRGFVRLFSIQRTLPWIKVNVIEKFTSIFARKDASNFVQNTRHGVLIADGDKRPADPAGHALNEIAA